MWYAMYFNSTGFHFAASAKLWLVVMPLAELQFSCFQLLQAQIGSLSCQSNVLLEAKHEFLIYRRSVEELNGMPGTDK